MAEFTWDPDTYLDLMAQEVPDYALLQQQLLAATRDSAPQDVLDLGIGSGLTAAAVLAAHPDARLVGIDDSAEMLAAAQDGLDPGRTTLLRGRLQDELPSREFELVISMLAVHHLDAAAKAALFARIARVLSIGGSFVLADLIVPVDPADVVTPVDGITDIPSPLADQLDWLEDAGLAPKVCWQHRDLAVICATKQHIDQGAGHPG